MRSFCVLAKQNSQRGFSLTELAIVLGAVGLLLGGIWAGGSAVSRGSIVRTGVNDTMSIITNARALYSGRSAARGVYGSSEDTDNTRINDNLVSAGIFPGSLLDLTTSPYTPYNNWHGQISIKRGITSNFFRIYYPGINSLESCIRYTTSFLGMTGLNAVRSGGTWVPVGPSSVGYTSTLTTYMTPEQFAVKASPACEKDSTTSTYTAGIEVSLIDGLN